MNQTNETTLAEDQHAQRAVIKSKLKEIAADIGDALCDAGLGFPVYLAVPNSGDSLATIACPLDPNDEDWTRASKIVCKIIGKRLGNARLRGHELVCAIANPTTADADVSAESVESIGVAGPALAGV